MPARSDKCETNVASARGRLEARPSRDRPRLRRFRREPSSLLRKLSGSVRARSRFNFTAAAFVRLAVMKFHAWPQFHRQNLGVIAPLPLRRKLRGELQVGSQISTSLSHIDVKTMRADERACPVRIEARPGSSCRPIRRVCADVAVPIRSPAAMAMVISVSSRCSPLLDFLVCRRRELILPLRHVR